MATVSATEVDEEPATIVGAPRSSRRRFLGLLTGYLLGAVPAILGLPEVSPAWFSPRALGYFRISPFPPLLAVLLLTPPVVGLLASLAVRSAPVTPTGDVTPDIGWGVLVSEPLDPVRPPSPWQTCSWNGR